MWQWWTCGLGATAAAVLLVGARLRLRRIWGRAAPGTKKSLRGKTVLVTGANSGLGRAAVQELVARGARVILACRDMERGRAAVQDIRKNYKPNGGEMIVMQLDLASFDSIKSFVEVIKNGFTKIDILINNAGVYLPISMNQQTKDGFEMHFGVNHLGHFLLTNLLLELLNNAAPSRVVIVSSLLHERGEIDFDDLNMTKIYEAVKNKDKTVLKKYKRHGPGYCNSKLMNVYFGRALAEKTKKQGIDVFTVCPGFTYTSLFRNSFRWYHYFVMAPFIFFYMRTPNEGVQSIIHCATDASLEGKSGTFYRNCLPYNSKIQFDKEVQEKLWAVSEALTEPTLKVEQK
ncbi:retinol dehydrogenase 14-like [Arctopsyche grandis]|uniref:retinol dehydrogenase 14-like n=1 Tax=Arctopsyche grandis TaxID=121162 RepID=UPI00406D78F7